MMNANETATIDMHDFDAWSKHIDEDRRITEQNNFFMDQQNIMIECNQNFVNQQNLMMINMLHHGF